MSFATSSFASAAFADLGSSSIVVSLSGVSSETDLGTLSVGVGDIVQVTGLQFGSSTGTITLGQGDQVLLQNSILFNTALSGATVSAEGSVAVIAPTDQMDFQLGTVLAEAQSIITPNPVIINTSLGSVDIEIISIIEPTAVTLTTTLDSVTVSVGTGVIVSATGIGIDYDLILS